MKFLFVFLSYWDYKTKRPCSLLSSSFYPSHLLLSLDLIHCVLGVAIVLSHFIVLLSSSSFAVPFFPNQHHILKAARQHYQEKIQISKLIESLKSTRVLLDFPILGLVHESHEGNFSSKKTIRLPESQQRGKFRRNVHRRRESDSMFWENTNTDRCIFRASLFAKTSNHS